MKKKIYLSLSLLLLIIIVTFVFYHSRPQYYSVSLKTAKKMLQMPIASLHQENRLGSKTVDLIMRTIDNVPYGYLMAHYYFIPSSDNHFFLVISGVHLDQEFGKRDASTPDYIIIDEVVIDSTLHIKRAIRQHEENASYQLIYTFSNEKGKYEFLIKSASISDLDELIKVCDQIVLEQLEFY